MPATSEGRLAAIVSAVPSALVVEDVERRIVLTNGAFCALFRLPFTPEELVGLELRPLVLRSGHVLPDPVGFVAELDRTVRDGRPARMEELHLTDGRILQRDYAPVLDAEGEVELHLWQYGDVTEALRMEEALRSSEAHLRAIFDHAPIGMFEMDADGGCVAVNRHWQALAGMTAEQAAGNGWLDAVHPADLRKVLDHWATDDRRGALVQGEMRLRTPTGKVSWVLASAVGLRDPDGQIAGHVGTALDITDRKRAEDALRASDARSAATIATAFDGIVSMDYQARILDFNAAAEAIFGRRRADVLGCSSVDLLLPEDRRAETHAGLREYLRTGRGRLIGRRVELPCLRSSGEVFLAEVAFTDIRDADPPTLTAFVRDISDRRQFEQELGRARDQALEASRLKSEFLAVMSHEIRTPMYGVSGSVDLLRDSDLDPQQRELVDILDESSRTLMGLIDEILDFSKIEAGRVELDLAEMDPAATVEGATEVFSAEARRRGLALMAVVDPDVPAAIRGDAGRLRQIVANLVGNALKFTAAGEVIVRLRRGDGDHELCLEVSDSGDGIPAAVQETLFEPFTQGDLSSRRAHGGTGLGLAICDGLARLMGGSIAVDSKPGEGTTMTVTIVGEPVSGARPTWEPPIVLRGRTAGVAMSSRRLAVAMRQALGAIGMEVPESVEPDGVDVWVAEVGWIAGVPAGTTMAVLGNEDRCVAPIPVRRARLAEIVTHALERAAPAAAHPAEEAADEGPEGGLDVRVLVVDDNDVNRTLVLHQLARLGVGGEGVASGPEAVEALRGRPYDAVLMDVRMPGMNGLEATRRIRALGDGERAGTPIIAMTADVQPQDRDICLGAGMDDHLGKPLGLDDLRRALASWLTQSSGRTSAPPPTAAFGDLQGPDGMLDALAAELGSEQAVVELLDLWLRELPKRSAELRRAVVERDVEALRNVAHILKSTSGMFGGAAAAPAAEIETLAQAGDGAGARHLLGVLMSALDSDVAEISRWRLRAAALRQA